MSISYRVLLSYISILSLLVLISYFGISGVNSVGDSSSRYRELAEQTNASGRVLEGMLDIRVLVNDYVIAANAITAEQVEAKTAETIMYINELKEAVDTDSRLRIAEEINNDLNTYIETFREVVSLQAEYSTILSDVLAANSNLIGDNFTQIMERQREAGNVEASYLTSLSLRSYLLARVNGNQYLNFNNENAYNLVIEELDNVITAQNRLAEALNSNDRNFLINDINDQIAAYKTGYLQIYQNITRRNNLINNTLDQIGPTVASKIAELNSEVMLEQDTLGPQIEGAIDSETTTTLILSLIALLLGGVFSVLVSRSISIPIVKMTNVMEALSNDDLEVEVPGIDREDEIGQMAGAVQIFKENAIRMRSNSTQIFRALQSKNSLTGFCREAIRQITPLMDGGHGVFYVYDDETETLSLNGSYGYNDRKELSNQFGLGQGLIGQCALERETITLTTVPDDYVKISSGLGSASPAAVIAIPVTHQENLLGVIEVASFKEFDDTAKRILEELITVLGLTMENIIRSEKTATLLQTTTAQAEALLQNEAELKASEEEMQASNEELVEKTKLLEQQTQALRESEEEARATNEELVEKTQIMQKQQETLKDISEENVLRARELEESNKYKSEFLANMSHELRTPLNSLLILSKSLADNADGDLNDDSVEAASIIHSSGEQLLNLINDILDLSKIEAGRVDTKPEISDIRDLMHMAERKFNHMAKEKEIGLNINVDEEVPNNFTTDPSKLDQILTNLIGNAIKFTDEGSVNVNVTSKDNDPRQIIVAVSDTGCGIPISQQKTVFEAFRQADGSSSRKFGGTGLGLSISKNLADLLNGEINLESEAGEGSTFTLTLNEMGDGVAPKAKPKAAKKPVKISPPKSVKKLADTLKTFIKDDRNDITKETQFIILVENKKKYAQVLLEDIRDRGISGVVVKDEKDALKVCTSQIPVGIIINKNAIGDEETFTSELSKIRGAKQVPVHFISNEIEDNQTSDDDENKEQDINKALDALFSSDSNKERNVLVVEDDKGSAIAIEKLISAENVTIDVAGTGKSAKDKVSKKDYDCVILDLTLPDMDGMEVLKKMAELNDNKNELLPVIVYSGRDLEIDMLSEIKQYTDSIIVKGGRSPERLLDEVALFLHSVKEEKKVTPEVNGTDITEQGDMAEILKDLEGKTVLAVDDDMRNTFALSRALREKGLNLLMAQDGNKALKQLDEHNNIQAVLMDIMMPVMDGYETIGEIRKKDEFKDLPIIALTAKAMKGDKEKCIEAGANSYLSKPIDIELLLQELHTLIK